MTNDILPLADRLALQATKQKDIITNLITDLQAYSQFLDDTARFWEGQV